MARSSTPRTTRSTATRTCNQSKKLIFLFGPTGVGKTELLLSLDPRLFSIINADSVQVYRGLDIGSAKAPKSVLARIEHHLIDVEDPWNQFTVARFITLADEACETIWDEGKVPILCGGTAFYFKHFLYGLSSAPESDGKVREHIAFLVRENGLAWAYGRLGQVDPVSQKRIMKEDSYRITRALEVYEQSGKPLSSFALPATARKGMEPLIIGLTRPPLELEERITLRVGQMFREGLVDEVCRLLREGATEAWPGMGGIGYREFLDARREGEGNLSTIKANIVRNSRLYAKRQMTFFKSFAQVNWFGPQQKKEIASVLESYLEPVSSPLQDSPERER